MYKAIIVAFTILSIAFLGCSTTQQNDEIAYQPKPQNNDVQPTTVDTPIQIEPDPEPVKEIVYAPEPVEEIKPAEVPPAPKPAKVEPVAKLAKKKPEVAVKKPVPVKVESKKKQYYLRIISLDKHEYFQKRAQGIADHLKNKGGINNAIVRQSGRYWVIDIGGYPSMRSKEAKNVHEKIKNMRYEGIYQFKDAYFINY